MDFSELKAETILQLGNLHSSHPQYGNVGDWVNRAMHRVIVTAVGANRPRPNLFPELNTSWKSPITTAGTNYLDLPTDKLAITDVFSFDTSSDPNLSTTRSLPMGWVPREHFEVIPRDSTVTGYPRLWTMKGKRIYIWPTPSASTVTYLHVYGIQREPTLSANSDEPLMNEIWHDAIVNFASYIGAMKLGWVEDAKAFRDAALEEIATAANISALETPSRASAVEIDGAMTRGSVYGT
jgi:hypothetical protein